MRKLMICVLVVFIALPVWAAQPETEDQKTFYALGAHLTKQLAVFNLSAEEFEFVKQGMTDAAAGNKLIADPQAYMQNISNLAKSRMEAAAQKQKEMGKSYQEKAAAEKDAKKTASGLIYKEIKAGNGAKPTAADTVRVHYTGTLIDGNEFDSSVKRGEPVEFPLGQVIPCWTEGVAMIKKGGKAKLVCPPDIAYGDQGRPPIIPGGATLVFEVELLDVKAPAAAPASKKKTVPAGKKP